jgi:hypothetical protein
LPDNVSIAFSGDTDGNNGNLADRQCCAAALHESRFNDIARRWRNSS